MSDRNCFETEVLLWMPRGGGLRASRPAGRSAEDDRDGGEAADARDLIREILKDNIFIEERSCVLTRKVLMRRQENVCTVIRE